MPRNDKKCVFVTHCRLTPNCYATPSNISMNLILPKSRLRGLHFLPLIVCVYLLSNFRGGLRKTHDRRRVVRIDPSRSSEVDDFRVIWKGLCDFISVINSNLRSISHRFWDTTTYRLKIANFPYPTSVQPQIWKCFFCTRSLKFCVRRAKTLR